MDRMCSRSLLPLLLAIGLATPCAAQGSADAQLLSGSSFDWRQDERDASDRKLSVSSRDPSLSLGDGNRSEDDPVLHGGELRLLSGAGLFDVSYALPASGWSYVQQAGANRGYRFRADGPITSARLRPGRGVEIRGSGLALPGVPGTSPGPLAAELRIGAQHYCLVFGGAVSFRSGASYRAKEAPAPAGCAPLAASLPLSGSVRASLEPGSSGPALPGAAVRLEDAAGAPIAEIESDAFGAFRFELAVLEPWRGRACATKAGFGFACREVALPRTSEPVELLLAPEDSAVVGTVLDRDGRPCFREPSVYDAGVRTEVSLDGAAPVVADAGGSYVIPSVLPGAHRIAASCALSNAAESFDVVPEDLDGGRSFDLALPNSRPVIEAVFARDASGRVVRFGTPGETLEAVARATDPDGDALTVRWWSDSRGELAGSGATLTWPLLEVEAQNLLRVRVLDDRGSAADDLLVIGTGLREDRISGRVVTDGGAPLAGITVRVDGVAARSDAGGGFRVLVPPADRHALEIAEPGFAMVSRAIGTSAAGLVVHVPRAAETLIDPTLPASAVDPASGAEVRFDERSLVDEDGDLATGPVTVSLHAFGMDEADPPPTDGLGRLAEGRTGDGDPEATAMELIDAVSVLVTDGDGSRYRPAPGTEWHVRIPRRDPTRSSDGQLFALDPATATWVPSSGALVPEPDDWIFSSPDAGVVAVGKLVVPSCRSYRAERGSIEVPQRITLRRFTGSFQPSGEPIYAFQSQFVVADYAWHALSLERAQYYQIRAEPTGRINATNAGPALEDHFRAPTIVIPTATPPAYAECWPYPNAGPLRRTTLEPFTTPWNNIDGSPTGHAYYQSIGAFPEKADFVSWLEENAYYDIETTEKPRARFFNRAELGLGRDLTCWRNGKGIACYIWKFGVPGGPVEQALDDLVDFHDPGEVVAMDSTGPSAPPRFYVFDTQGHLKPATSFGGDPIAVPLACEPCHGARFGPIDPNTHEYPASAPREAQADSVRRLNAMLRPFLSEAGRLQVQRLYPTGVDTPGAQAILMAPPAYQKDGDAGYDHYLRGVRDHCQFCHMNRWSLAGWTEYRPSQWAVCQLGYGTYTQFPTFMPRAFVMQRNLWVDPTVVPTLFLPTSLGPCKPLEPLPLADQKP